MAAELSKFGVAVTTAIETVLAAEDIYRLYRMSEEGRISDDDFVYEVWHRISTAAGSIYGTCTGAAVGGVFGGFPGAFIGGAIGSLIGGRVIGKVFKLPRQVREFFQKK